MSSIRRRLTLSVLLYSGITLVMAGVAVILAVRLWLTKEFDSGLAARARAIANDVEYDPQDRSLEYHVPMNLDSLIAIQVVDGKGRELGHSGPAAWIDTASADGLEAHDVNRLRVHQVTLSTPALIEDPAANVQAPTIRVRVSLSTDQLRSQMAMLERMVAIVGSVIGLGSGVAMVLLGRLALAPLDRLASRIQGLEPAGPRNAPTRLPLDGVPDELRPVVLRLNELMERVAAGLSRERRFNAAMAHELRTPIAGLQATIDVQRASARTDSDHQQAWSTCDGIVQRMRVLVQDLLLLSRADAGLLAGARAAVDLPAVLAAAWAPLAAQAHARAQRVCWELGAPFALESDASLLGLVARNLLENAVAHGRAGGEITVELRQERGVAVLEVVNDGAKVSAQDVPRLFDRAWSSDHARAHQAGHAGLGLALCSEVMRVLGGGIEASVTGSWFTARVRLPATAGSASR